mmetsp:Transcript_34095/g.6145  ORF Transcript_34095/g.6145 Transcript_34095/m.6145 type:complete len:81 (-) Transcript_34095:694-936(-)
MLCSALTILFIYNVVDIEFDRLLEISNITALDFWQLLTNFYQFDQKMPAAIKRYFKELEIKIINKFAWVERSPLLTMITS